MSSQLLNLNPLPNQTLTVSLAINGGSVSLGLRQYWNRVGGFWALDIYDGGGNPLIYSVPLVTGDWPGANILSPFEYMQIGEAYVINQNGATSDIPTETNLGQTQGFSVIWTDNTAPGSIPLLPQVPPISGSGNWSSYNVSGLAVVLG